MIACEQLNANIALYLSLSPGSGFFRKPSCSLLKGVSQNSDRQPFKKCEKLPQRER